MTEQRTDPPVGAEARGRFLLRAARQERGWSQSRAARELAELSDAGEAESTEEAGTATKRSATRAASLKTQLSRWENGHAEPDVAHRMLLGTLYDRDPRELGLGSASAPDRTALSADADVTAALRRALSEADAVDDTGLDAWREQLDAAVRLDRRLGTAGAGAVVATVFDRTAELLDHVVRPRHRRELAAVVAAAGVLAGVQAADRRDLTLAWARFGAAGRAAAEADRTDLAERAAAERARLLVEAGRPELVPAALNGVRGPWADLARAEADAAVPGDRSEGADHPDPVAAHTTPATGARRTIDSVTPGLPVEAEDIRHHHAVVRVRRGDPGARADLERTLADPGRSVRERTEAGAVLAVALRQAGDPDAGAAAARAHVAALRTGSDRMIALLTGAGHGTPARGGER